MGVLSTSQKIENFNISQVLKKFKIPIFQNSKQQKQKNQKKQKNNSAQTMGGRGGEAKSWHNCFFKYFGKLKFWKLPLGRGGLRQNRILSVAQKSVETQYKYRNKIQTK